MIEITYLDASKNGKNYNRSNLMTTLIVHNKLALSASQTTTQSKINLQRS